MMNLKAFYIVILFFIGPLSLSNEVELKTKKNKEEKVVDFTNIRKVLKNDGLLQEILDKKKEIQKKSQEKIDRSKGLYLVPGEDQFWSFFSEYWLIKNATILKWDFRKPDYAVVETMTVLLESLGFYEKRIKLLYLNTPNVTHFGLPSNPNEYIFLVSIPFIRNLDLTKLEISLLLLEDFFRIEEKMFRKSIKTANIKKIIGTNFFGKKLNTAALSELLKEYDQHIYVNGYPFKEQFKITKKMDTLLKSDEKLWSTYYRLLTKIDGLVKTNLMFEKHLKIYPSPELQLNWLRPKKKAKY